MQRRNVAPATSSQSRDDYDDDEKLHRKEEEGVEDHDSKETRLTLMEEVLLLGLKDREVRLDLCQLYITFCEYYQIGVT